VDLDSLALKPEEMTLLRLPRRRAKKEAFLAGPLKWGLLDKAAALPGRALHLWLILNHKARLSGNKEVAVCLSRIGHGLDRQMARRALRRLEKAGLVAIDRKPGCSLKVFLQGEEKGNCKSL
jgi:hypothetical protein